MTEKVIKLKNVIKKYTDTNVSVLKDLSLELEQKKIYFICGPSGVGKSTLLHIIGLMDHPTSGEVYLFGERIDYKDKNKISSLRIENIGFMFQFHYLLENLTVYENILLPYWIKNKVVTNMNINLFDFVEHLGIKNLLSRYPYELSGGEQQRVSLARAIVNNPKLIIADEPTGNLDHYNAIKIVEHIKMIVEKYSMTALIATHNLELTKYGNFIINLQSGEIKNIIKNS